MKALNYLPLKLLVRLIALACLLSLSGYLARYYFLFEQIDSFRTQYFLVALAGMLLALLCRQWLALAILFCVAGLHGSELARLYLPVSDPGVPSHLRVMSVNLLASNHDNSRLLSEINAIEPDLIVFQEYTTRWHQMLSSALNSYPHSIHEVIDTPFGIAAYSKLPFRQQAISYFNQRLSPAVDVELEVNTQSVRVLGIHPIPPMSSSTFDMRNRYFDDLAQQSVGGDQPLIIIGDFNATPWSYHFKALLNRAGLKSSRDGFELHPTWPGGFWPLWTPIDHIVHNQKVQLIHFDSGNRFGSDHTPVWADLHILNNN